MPRMSMTAAATNALSRILDQRKGLLAAIAKAQAKLAAIEEVFARAGVSLGAAKAAAKRATAGKRRKRGTFAHTGEESVLAFIKKTGKPSTKEINDHWKREKRGGSANNTLTKLFKDGKVKRHDDPNVRGSRYSVA